MLILTYTGLQCWNFNRQFLKDELLTQHFKTVMHHINCRKLTRQDKSEMPPKIIAEILTEYRTEKEKAKCPYRSRLYERNIFLDKQKRDCRDQLHTKIIEEIEQSFQ